MLSIPRFIQIRKASALALVLTSLAMIIPSAPAVADTLSIASAINKAGRQRMLSQRIVKAYCLLRLGVKPEASQKILQNSVNLFESQLIELRSASSKTEIQQAWTKESEAWMRTRLLALSAPDAEGVKQLNDASEPLLESAHKLTQLLEVESGKKSGHWVNVAGRQRMLSQRIAKLYLLKKLGLNTPEISAALDRARSEFVAAHEGLVGGAVNNPHIVAELRLAKTHWNFFSLALDSEQNDSLDSVATTSERILEVMDRVTGMFERAYGD